MSLRVLSAVALCVACGACETITGLRSGRIGGEAALVTGRSIGGYDWSSDSRTIYFTGATGDGNRKVGVWRVDVTNGRQTTVVPTLPGTSAMRQTLRIVKPAGAAEKLYVGLNQETWCSPGTIFRLPASGGQWDTLATDVDNSMFATSREGRHVAFTSIVFPKGQELCPAGRDSFVVMSTTSAPAYDRRSVERGVSSNEIQPLSLSAGGALVYARGVSEYTVIRFADAGGSSRELIRHRAFGGDTSHALSQDVVWRGDTPTLLFTRTIKGRSGADVFTVDGAAGLQTPLAVIPDAIAPASLAQSADGKSWAGWFVVGDLTPNAVERHNLRYRLYVKTPDQSGVRMLAEVEGYEGPRKLRVSPDGSRVSFVNREFYVLSMP